MIQIRHRETGEVLLEVADDTLRGHTFDGAKLRGADLTPFDLTEVDFRNSDLTDADLRGVTGIKAVFKSALMRRALFIEANFIEADFTDALLEHCQMRDGNFTGAVFRYAKLANADSFIHRLPHGYATPLSERGNNLSEGQRQLLSFARALAHTPEILVLDEATSSVDTETEELIQDAVDELQRGRTSLVIAHRLSTIEKADRILVLHRGELREHGTHAELMARGGLYATLYRLQHEPLDAPPEPRATR